jgi:hypothetical protein
VRDDCARNRRVGKHLHEPVAQAEYRCRINAGAVDPRVLDRANLRVLGQGGDRSDLAAELRVVLRCDRGRRCPPPRRRI